MLITEIKISLQNFEINDVTYFSGWQNVIENKLITWNEGTIETFCFTKDYNSMYTTFLFCKNGGQITDLRMENL